MTGNIKNRDHENLTGQMTVFWSYKTEEMNWVGLEKISHSVGWNKILVMKNLPLWGLQLHSDDEVFNSSKDGNFMMW